MTDLLQRIFKGANQSLDEEMHRVRSQTEEFLSLWSLGPACSHVRAFWLPNLETLQAPSFGVLMEISLYRHDRLNHWPWVIDSTSRLLPSPEVFGMGLKLSTLYSGLVPLDTSPQP